MQWNKITLVGVGLLGGSLGLAVRRAGLAGEVAGYVRRNASVKECADADAVDFATTDLAEALWNADLVILCTPIGQMRFLAEQMPRALKRGAIVTDVGSAKRCVVKQLEGRVARAGGHFVGSHPMAGAEKTGVAAARADLFENAVCVVTPTPRTQRAALRRVEQFWQAVGSRVLCMPPDTHDALVSRSSHLPHLIAAALAGHVLNPKHPKRLAALCANGFRDATRVASGSPEMWRDIALANRLELRKALDEFLRELRGVQALLERGDLGEVLRFYETAKARRDAWCAQTASSSSE